MPYFDGKNKLNYAKYESTTIILNDLINKYTAQNKEIIMCGDFNTDFHKNQLYNKILRDLCKLHKFKAFDIVFGTQTVQHTYFKKYKNATIST